MWSSGEPRPAPRRSATLRAVAVLAGVFAGGVLAAGPGPLASTAAARSAPGVPYPPPLASSALTATGSVADLVVNLSVSPNRPGPNAFTIEVTSSRRPPPAPVDHVRLVVAGRTVPLVAVDPGRYVGSGGLEHSGPVRAAVVIARHGGRLEVAMRWPVGSAAPAAAAPPPPSSGSRLGGLGLVWAVLLPSLLGALVLAGRRLARAGRHPDPAGAAGPRAAAPAGTSGGPDGSPDDAPDDAPDDPPDDPPDDAPGVGPDDGSRAAAVLEAAP